MQFHALFIKMEMTTIVGYHGAALSHKNNILENGFKSDIRSDHWLGQGIYFYDDEDLAKWWAETKYKNEPICIIKAEIEADISQILNLDKHNQLNFFLKETENIFKKTSQKFKFSKLEDETNRKKNLCAALDVLKRHLDIRVVIYTFPKQQGSYGFNYLKNFEQHNFPLPLYVSYKETQICVTKQAYISTLTCIYPIKRKW